LNKSTIFDLESLLLNFELKNQSLPKMDFWAFFDTFCQVRGRSQTMNDVHKITIFLFVYLCYILLVIITILKLIRVECSDKIVD
jgi:hypothetical protein